MARVSKIKKATARVGAQKAIGRMLKAELDDITREPLPPHFTGLLVLIESHERVERVSAKVEQLRQGLKKR